LWDPQGEKVELRFWNYDELRDLNAVCDTIIAYVGDQSLQPWR
jgi:hypothetical protein